MQQVTFGDEDIEFYNPNDNGFNPLKPVVWDSGKFNSYVARVGTLTALEQVTVFHRTVAN